MAMSPEPALSVTCGPDSALPEMSPDPVCRLTAPVSRFALHVAGPGPGADRAGQAAQRQVAGTVGQDGPLARGQDGAGS